jgi:hypothetical protein
MAVLQVQAHLIQDRIIAGAAAGHIQSLQIVFDKIMGKSPNCALGRALLRACGSKSRYYWHGLKQPDFRRFDTVFVVVELRFRRGYTFRSRMLGTCAWRESAKAIRALGSTPYCLT